MKLETIVNLIVIFNIQMDNPITTKTDRIIINTTINMLKMCQ